MTRLLEQALAELRKLSPEQQDTVAAIILDELADERRWDETFARSQDQLGRLANQAREQIRAGQVRQVGIDEL